jgi:hypothetical protein
MKVLKITDVKDTDLPTIRSPAVLIIFLNAGSVSDPNSIDLWISQPDLEIRIRIHEIKNDP